MSARLRVVGASWRDVSVAGLQRYFVAADERPSWLPSVAHRIGADELVYLATCNRVEVIGTWKACTGAETGARRVFEALRGRLPDPSEMERELRWRAGEAALEHLCRVAAGLDSAMLGETEIAGQMRRAVETSRCLGLVGPTLDQAFAIARRVARQVRRDTPIGVGSVSLASIALRHAREHLDRSPGPVALVGVSAMTRACGKALRRAGIPVLVYNRTAAGARRLAADIDGRGDSLAALRRGGDGVAVVIAATGSAGPVLSCADLARIAARAPGPAAPLIIDLATPPDVDAGDAMAVGVTRVGLEDIVARSQEHTKRRAAAVPAAAAIVRDAVVRAGAWG